MVQITLSNNKDTTRLYTLFNGLSEVSTFMSHQHLLLSHCVVGNFLILKSFFNL